MTKQEMFQTMLIKPKKLTLGEGVFKKNAAAEIYTNLTADLSFLLGKAGFSAKPQEMDFEGAFVLAVGSRDLPRFDLDFKTDEAYQMILTADSLFIAGKTEEAVLLGLKALIRMEAEFDAVPCMTVTDWPDIPFRAIHLCVFPENDGTEKEPTAPSDIKHMIEKAALCGYNYVFIEFWGMFPYSIPWAHWPDAYTKEDLLDIVSFAMDKWHIRPLPAQNLTSHAGWSRITSRKHVVLDQNPAAADMYIPGGWCFATENPKTKEFLHLLIDEMAEIFRNPPFFHACCDKAFGFGSSNQDRTTCADVLFLNHVSSLNTYLREKNIRMVMWGDMLYSSMDALYWKCRDGAADLLVKNILINVWTHNDPGTKWQDVSYFESRGFETVYSPFINRESIRNMITLCKESGSYGIVQTTWFCPATALPYCIYSGALQWCGQVPDEEQINAFANR